MCSRACNIRRRGLIVFYVKKLARVRSESIKEEILAKMFLFFFFFFSNCHFCIAPPSVSSSADYNLTVSRAHLLSFRMQWEGQIVRIRAYLEDRYIMTSVEDEMPTKAQNRSEFKKKRCIIRWVLCKFWLNLRRRRLRLNCKTRRREREIF